MTELADSHQSVTLTKFFFLLRCYLTSCVSSIDPVPSPLPSLHIPAMAAPFFSLLHFIFIKSCYLQLLLAVQLCSISLHHPLSATWPPLISFCLLVSIPSQALILFSPPKFLLCNFKCLISNFSQFWWQVIDLQCWLCLFLHRCSMNWWVFFYHFLLLLLTNSSMPGRTTPASPISHTQEPFQEISSFVSSKSLHIF